MWWQVSIENPCWLGYVIHLISCCILTATDVKRTLTLCCTSVNQPICTYVCNNYCIPYCQRRFDKTVVKIRACANKYLRLFRNAITYPRLFIDAASVDLCWWNKFQAIGTFHWHLWLPSLETADMDMFMRNAVWSCEVCWPINPDNGQLAWYRTAFYISVPI